MKKKRQHCLYCGAGIVKKEEDNVLRDYCPDCHCFFYENPLPVVSSILDSFRNILLVKRGRRPSRGLWCLPTGFAEAGESIEDAALRELEEETGIRGRVLRLLDVHSYNSRFYGDLLFLTFVVEQIGGDLTAGDDCAQARFFPTDKIPRLAFRPNKFAIDAYINSKKDYWAVVDSIKQSNQASQKPEEAKNDLTQRLVNVIIKSREKINDRWVEEVIANPSTSQYHNYDRKKIYILCDRMVSQIILWLGGLYEVNRLKIFYLKLGKDRRREGFKISASLSALSLLRRHIWDIALSQGEWHKSIDLYVTFELQRRMTIFFDLATFYMTRGYEEGDL